MLGQLTDALLYIGYFIRDRELGKENENLDTLICKIPYLSSAGAVPISLKLLKGLGCFPTRCTNGGYRRALLAKYVHIEGKNARWVPSCIACYRCFHLSKRMASFAILYQQRRSHVRQKFKVAIAVPCLLQTFELFFIFPIFSKIERRRYGNYLHFLHSAPPLSERN